MLVLIDLVIKYSLPILWCNGTKPWLNYGLQVCLLENFHGKEKFSGMYICLGNMQSRGMLI